MNTEWKPIASAPKDGTPVLLFARHIDAEASTRVVGSFNQDYGWIAQSYVGQPFARLIPSLWAELLPFPGTPPASAQDDANDDITQRLRDNADLDAAEDGNPAVIRLEREAADEIDRLRRALADAPAAGDALDAINLPIAAARMIRREYLPSNPRRMSHVAVRDAVEQFLGALQAAEAAIAASQQGGE
ncbi:YjbH domain-containing protein [Achromobacter sp. NFACC18-2]|uniref:YjbH domain-containing protein n=1 Tax=Achromobacter sp. NFACC18-2 TaxID=1564112 RepID=UPI0008CA797F|nr:YjbH domain-containing protein [Achromobacter sp. NFACC18-2]SEK09537.1 hypothetical protein SAMN03159494_05189 [Achromobacter sp. NFACC18-2]